MSETIPKVVVDQYRRVEQAKRDLKLAMQSRGIQVGDDETIDTYAAKLTAHEVPRIAIFKVSQFQGFLDEKLPAMYVSPSYIQPDLSLLFYRCNLLKELPNIEGLERAVTMKNFVSEAVALEELRLPDLPQVDNMRELAKSCTGLKKAVVGALPKARNRLYVRSLLVVGDSGDRRSTSRYQRVRTLSLLPAAAQGEALPRWRANR